MKSRTPKRPAQQRNQRLKEKFLPETFATGIHIFADGAAVPNPGAGGWGVAVFEDGVETASAYGGDIAATNNQMELCALLNAIEHAKRLAPASVVIWSDSQYCVKGVNEWRHSWKKLGWQRGSDKAEPKNRILMNADLWRAIDAAMAGAANIAVKWCKGHAGIAGNERADELAEAGRQCDGQLSRDDDQLSAEYRAIMGGRAA